ncbi:hypothetical protein FQN49_007673, partial [Arthroderma sp. PD_2]
MSGLEIALGAAGILSLIDLCFECGGKLVQKFKDFQAAGMLINEAVTAVQHYWLKTTWQLNIVREARDGLGEEFLALQDQVLRILLRKLDDAVLQISKIEKKHRSESEREWISTALKCKYVFSVKKCLDKALREIMKWQEMYDPSWYLIMIRYPSTAIDARLAKACGINSKPNNANFKDKFFHTIYRLRDRLRKEPQIRISVFLPAGELATARISGIPFSNARLVDRPGKSTLIQESAVCDRDSDGILILTDVVRELAGKLMNVDISFSILECAGAVKFHDPKTRRIKSFDFLFKIPRGLRHPQSLRSVLLSSPDKGHSLSARFRIAQQLATSVSFVHALGFVHKNVRPETLLVFDDGQSPLGSLFL